MTDDSSIIMNQNGVQGKPLGRPRRHMKGPPLPFFMSNNGAFDPELMFCSICNVAMEEEKKEVDDAKTVEADREDGNVDQDPDVVILKTRFSVSESAGKAPQEMQSLLEELPGVSLAVVNAEEQSFVIDHDRSVSSESVLNALKSTGCSAVVLDTGVSNTEPVMVRSQFSVQGICCASEVPPVRKIVKPLPGVSRVQINILTKVVSVQHDSCLITAQEISEKLSSNGFPAEITHDGNASAIAKQKTRNHGHTVLQIHGRFSYPEIRRVQGLLKDLTGISRMAFTISDSLVQIDHDMYTVTSEQCRQALTPDFNCWIQSSTEQAIGDAVTLAFESLQRSRFVESTIRIEGLNSQRIHEVKTLLSKGFEETHIRAAHPNLAARTIKIEHDPEFITVENVCRFLTSHGFTKLHIAVDGAESGLYLPEGNPSSDGLIQKEENSSLLKIHANIWVSGIFWILSTISYVEGCEWFGWFGIGSVIFGLPPICFKALRTLRRRDFDANCMMVTAALGSVILGDFTEAASVSFLFSVSGFLEAQASTKARKALRAIVSLRPEHANVIHPVSKEILVVPADHVPPGSLISVKAGDKVAADGIVVEGSTAIDESSLTGEARPAHKNVGDTVRGGTINIGISPLVVRTITSVDDSAVARLIRLVEDAQSNRSKTEIVVDTFARSYTPTVMLFAFVMCTIPWAFGIDVGRYWTLNGLIIVVVACPCALTISTPVTYAAALAATAQRGIIVKGGGKLEAMGNVDRIVFDKTGTLTKGKFSVEHLEVVGTMKTREEMLQLMVLMEERSSHPLAVSLVEAANLEGVRSPRHIKIANHTILKGEGITASVGGAVVYVGNERLFNRLDMLRELSTVNRRRVTTWSRTGGTIGFIGIEDAGIIGMYCVTDAVREEAKAVMEGFKKLRIDTIICTGDSDSAAKTVAREIGIPARAVHSQLLPEDKLHFVGSLKRPEPSSFAICREKRYVLFCGDGVNDAPALAIADVGVSMGEGAAMAMEISDVTLMDSNLTKLLYTIQMGKRVLRTVKENIFISLLAKGVVVGATFFGKTTLLVAIVSDVGIMLLVTLNGMKLLPSTKFDGEGPNRYKRSRDQKIIDDDGEFIPLYEADGNESNDVSFDPEVGDHKTSADRRHSSTWQSDAIRDKAL